VIFNSSNSVNEKMNDLIKARIRIQKPYIASLTILIDFGDSIIENAQSIANLYDVRI